MSDNLALWNRHRTPHRDALKAFRKGGGFSGTAIDAMWLIREATDEWGPIGGKWGVKILNESYVDGHTLGSGDRAVLHVVLVELWYPEGSVQSYGQTFLISEDKNGTKTDEEAPKKSLTDAVSKALSWLGFGSDVHMGMFDGNKYVDLKTDKPKEEPKPAPPEKPNAITEIQNALASIVDIIGKEEMKGWWTRFLKNSDHSNGLLSLAQIEEKLPKAEQWLLYEELKANVEHVINANEKKEN